MEIAQKKCIFLWINLIAWIAVDNAGDKMTVILNLLFAAQDKFYKNLNPDDLNGNWFLYGNQCINALFIHLFSRIIWWMCIIIKCLENIWFYSIVHCIPDFRVHATKQTVWKINYIYTKIQFPRIWSNLLNIFTLVAFYIPLVCVCVQCGWRKMLDLYNIEFKHG